MLAAERIGSVIGSKYRLEKLLGEGGMGAVFRATHMTVGKQFAIKVLHADMSKHPEAKRRFTKEAQAAAKIGHPAILDVYDLGEDEGSLYMVMELLAGESLAERVARGPLPITEALRAVVGVLDALEAAHEANIVHRDIKPANIFLIEGAEGTDSVRVLDFGIAKFQESPDGTRTATGAVLGSPLYMAPEQVRGESDIDERADIWGVGATLYELLAGEPAHAGPTHAAVIVKIVMKAAPLVSESRHDVDAKLDSIVARALSIDPEKRFASAAEMREMIETYLVERAATVISDPPPSLSASAQARRRKRSEGSGHTPRALVAATDMTPLAAKPTGLRPLLPHIIGILALTAIGAALYFSPSKPVPTADPPASTTPVSTASAPVPVPVPVPVPGSSEAPSTPPPSASAITSASAPASGSASAPQRAITASPPSPPPRATATATTTSCAPNEVLTLGHCCPRGFMWQDGHCERDIAVTAPF